jgi:isoquinoline 1-oxidoreductase alpha subunit
MELRINDGLHRVDAAILWVLRDDLGMTGTKYGCGIAQCGGCSVLVDGRITRSCVTPIDSVAGKHITTIEAVERDPVGARGAGLDEHQVPQCGYCQSGQVIAATALLKEVAQPSDGEITAMVNPAVAAPTMRSARRCRIWRAASRQRLPMPPPPAASRQQRWS